MGKSFQRGFIQRVEFAGSASRRQTRIIIFARLGRANVPEEVVMKAASGVGPNPNIATLPRRYELCSMVPRFRLRPIIDRCTTIVPCHR
jgi:hypothetical protein